MMESMSKAERDKRIQRAKDMIKYYDAQKKAALKGPNKALAKKMLKNETELEEMKKDDAYAIGMAQAKKSMNDEPPLDKKTITKGHEIAKKILNKEEVAIVYTDKKTRQVVSKKFKNDAEASKWIKQFDGAAGQINFKPSSMLKNDVNDEPPLDKKTIKKGHEIADKLMGMKKEETIKEFKKMTVTFKTMDKMAKASTDLAKHGFTIHAKGLVMKVDGKGDDLNKYATDLKNFYGATVKAEENAPTLSDLERMKKQGLKPKKEETQHDLAKMKFEQIAGLKKKAEKSGMPYSILKKVYDRGMAAWRGGHRPGASQQQWAFARVNSFVTKSSGTWGGADKDLAKQVRGK